MRSSDSAAFEGTASTKDRAAIGRIRGAGDNPRFRCGKSPAPTAVSANTHPAIVSTDPVIITGLNRVQLTTDGHKADLEAVEGAFGKMGTTPGSSSCTPILHGLTPAAARRSVS